MIEENMMLIADKMKLAFLRRIFDQVREREGSLSAMEAFSVEMCQQVEKTFTEDEKKLLSQFLERLATVID